MRGDAGPMVTENQRKSVSSEQKEGSVFFRKNFPKHWLNSLLDVVGRIFGQDFRGEQLTQGKNSMICKYCTGKIPLYALYTVHCRSI